MKDVISTQIKLLQGNPHYAKWLTIFVDFKKGKKYGTHERQKSEKPYTRG